MAKINTEATTHGRRVETYSDGSSVIYEPFKNKTPLQVARLAKVERAFAIVDALDARIDLSDPCNQYFKTLPKHRSFRHRWRSGRIFFNFSPSTEVGLFGATHSNNRDIALTAWCIDTKDRWMIAATMVHEVAHAAGAPGGDSPDAEKAADKCGFKPQYNPDIVGSIEGLGIHLQRLA